MKNTQTLSDRLLKALKHSGMRKTELARAIGVSPQVIHHLCSSKTRSTRFAFELAEALQVNLEWLTSGNGPMLISDAPEKLFLQQRHAVPMLQISDLGNYLQKYCLSKLEINDYFYITKSIEHAFAVHMPDASMQPQLNKNTLLIFDPTIDSLNDGDIALLYLEKFDEYVVRQTDNRNKQFLPHNTEMYKAINMDDAKPIAKLIAYYWETD